MKFTKTVGSRFFLASLLLGALSAIWLSRERFQVGNEFLEQNDESAVKTPELHARALDLIVPSGRSAALQKPLPELSRVSAESSDRKVSVAQSGDSQKLRSASTMPKQALPAWPAQLREFATHSFDLDELTRELSRKGFHIKKEQKGNKISGKRIELSATNKFGETVFSQYFVDDSGKSSFDSLSLKAPSTQDAFRDLIEQSEVQFGLEPALRKGKNLAAVYGIDGKDKTLSLIFDKRSALVTVTIEKTECESAL